MWTFGRRIAVGFGLSFALLVFIGAIAYRSIDALVRTGNQVAHTHRILAAIDGVVGAMADAETGHRGFAITGDESFLEPYLESTSTIAKDVKALRELTRDDPNQQKHLDDAEPLVAAKLAHSKRSIEMRRTRGFEEVRKFVQSGEGKGIMDDLRRVLGQMKQEEDGLLTIRAAGAEAAAAGAESTIVLGTLLALVLTTGVGVFITRSLSSQIGSAVQHVQSSSSELQAAANQQATAAKEQSTAMNEISTTISELLTTSRQIAESAQRVAGIAAETAGAARSGDQTVERSQDSVGAIRRQVDVIVAHMVELGKKSQQIGGVLEIINELAEQTNILAINATIEASGAGEAGRRFAVVADEIRKLADRVGGSTKEIRGLVDDVRAAVNTTVMATEGGSKAVDVGTRQFGEVAASFRLIAGLVSTTTEAAREIELSTKQQASAVEQVTVAVANVSQTAKETEASSSQTLQTSSQLSTLSRELARVIRPQAGA